MISVTILVKNGGRKLREVLQALSSFDEIVVYDTGSTDATLEIARSDPKVTLYQKPFIGFGYCRNEAARLAKHDWILAIDADEVLSQELVKEIHQLLLKEDTVYSLPYQNYFNGKHIKWCGWYPERHIRLYHRKNSAFSEVRIHEGVLSNGLNVVPLSHPVFHYPYETISDFLIKMERYSTLFADQYRHQRESSPAIALIHGVSAFFKSFFLKKGFLGGFEGFLISVYNGHTAFYKYLKLYLANQS